MKFSWFHLPTFVPEVHGSDAQFYQDMLTETDKAEALGFHAVWCAEHHFYNYGGHIPSVPVLGSAIAQRTKRLRIGSGIALAPLQDPIRLAEEFAMLDCLSGGRLDFGIGRGFQKIEYDAFERNMADSRVLFEEAHAIIIKAWTQERFSHEGKFRTVENLRVIPKPVQKLPPVYVAAIFTPDSFEWTGRQGYNLMVVPYAVAKPEILAGNLKLFTDSRIANDHNSEPDILGVYHFYCGETAEKAREEAREPMMRYLAIAGSANEESAYSQQYAAYTKLREGFKMMDYDRYLYPQRVIFGDPDQCVERIAQIRATGITNIGLIGNFGGLERTKILASLDRFAKYVMPRVTREA